MYVGKSVFSQVMEFLPLNVFRRCVARYNGDFNIQTFSCLDQFFQMDQAKPQNQNLLR
jgi:hypothetical protein